jgi:phosphoribosylpyrophosphate synthetase
MATATGAITEEQSLVTLIGDLEDREKALVDDLTDNREMIRANRARLAESRAEKKA